MPRLVPRVAAVHDLSSFGRCSLTVILPVLSAMGAQCCPIPTAYLSAHLGFPKSERAVFHDMTDQIGQTAAHWKELGLKFDAVYSGFLGNPRQIDVLASHMAQLRRPGGLILVDPVMGDHGTPYRTCTPGLCRRMADLAAKADLITPNFTEAALLLGEDYAHRPTDEAGVRTWLERLSQNGARSVVLTGVSFRDGLLGAGGLNREDGSIRFAMAPRKPGRFSGTGDLFASVLLGELLQGARLDAAMDRAVRFVSDCVGHTLDLGTPVLEGVQFEPLLKKLFS